MLNRQKNDYYFNIFLNLARAMYMQLEKDWDKEAKLCGISYAQQHALWLLHVQDGLTLEELGNIAIWNKSTTSALISRLEKKGLVEKRKDEGSRLIRIYLTEEGYKRLMKVRIRRNVLNIWDCLRIKRKRMFVRVLSLMKELVDEIHQGKNPDFNTFINEYSQNLLK